MTVLAVRVFPDPVLRGDNKLIDSFDDERIQTLIDDMIETMMENNGVGIAAPQVGINLMLAIVKKYSKQSDEESVLVLGNPKIIDKEGEQIGEEGCLSFPGIYEDVVRPLKVLVEATDRNGVKRTIEGEGFFARALAHEIDHLNAKLLIDHVSVTRRMMIKTRLKNKREKKEKI